MTSRSVVFAEPVRTAIGTFGGTSQGRAGAQSRRRRDRRRGCAREASPRRGGNRRHGQRRAGRHQDESGPAGCRPCRAAGHGAGAHGQPRLRLRSAGHRLGSAGDFPGQHQCRGGGWHGEHGPGALSHRARPLGLPHGRRPALRQRAARRLERRVLGRAFRLAYRGSGREIPGHPRGAGPLGLAIAAALRRRAGRRSFQIADRAGGGPRQEGTHASSTRTSTTGPTRRSKHWRGSSRRSVPTAPSPPATRPD